MAGTVINLADPISTLVTKTNTISNHIGDITNLNVGGANDSDLVQAINFINGIVQKTDSADILKLILANSVDTGESIALIRANSVDTGETTSLITANSVDSSEVINLIDSAYVQARETAAVSIRAQFQKDSANAIGYDSSQGRFFVPPNTINTAMLEGNIPNSKLANITTAGKVSLGALEIDGATDIGADLADADLIIVDDGANGTERKSAMSRIPTYVFGKVSGDATIASGGALTIANDAVEEDMIADDAVSSTQLKTLSTLLIKDTNGSTLKTIHGAGA